MMNSVPSPESIMYKIIQKKDAVNRMSERLDNGHKVFKELYLEMPKCAPAELGLLRVVSWFYVLYTEAGEINVEFLTDRFESYSLDPDKKLSNHRRLVNQLRTYFQHNLNPNKPRDLGIKEYCESWFKLFSGTLEPEEENEWSKCLNGFLKETLDFFDAMLKCIRKIEQDESREQIIKEWNFRRDKYHPPQDFDKLIIEVASDMGRESLDAIRLRKRFYPRWIKEFETRVGNYDFETEARKLIEYTILNETSAILPITGRDIIQMFAEIEPGPMVGELLEKAKIINDEEPCSSEQLLEKLRSDFDSKLK